ncbi:TonB-dependent receptor [Geomesophilobacter sediminis]|uniref:TonB-dependent receptor plug domain-containing protein n=1 Tax=Geomesophilobacter sediminis TaxID=2798584 RepID=A0A8J7IQS7_9BACT|nr:TonB-dependent receptor plug domain-containing protein [Geomesophilobacter sediminis]MBJ6725074.1 TonB-dependent receptor plug domain-containing protein [Geomesophilobacter sediminis]
MLTAIMVALLAWPGGDAHAMGTPEDQSEDIFTLGEVVVSGKLDAVEAAQTVHVITAEEIRKAGSRTLDEALNLLSDVGVQVGNEGVPRVDIRGFRTRHVLLLLDGVPMNSSFDQQFDPSTIPVENIAKIKVTAGASSVLYGQGGLGGVINIITKKGKEGVSGMTSFESGDGQPYLAKGSVSGGRGMFDFFASGSVFHRDHFPLARSFSASPEEAAGYRKNSDNTRDNAFFNVGFTPNSDLTIALTGSWVQGGYGKPASAINNKFDPYAPPARFGRVDWYEGYTLQLAADYAISPALTVRSSIFYNQIDQDNNQYDDDNYGEISTGRPDAQQPWLIDPTNPNVPNSFKLRNRGITRGISLQPKYDLGHSGTVTLGLSAEWDSWDGRGLVKPGGQGGNGGGSQGGYGVGGGSPPYLLNPVHDSADVYLYSAALEYSVLPTARSGFTAGYAHHWQQQGGSVSQLASQNDLAARPAQQAQALLDDYSVSVSSYYDATQSTRLKAAFMRNIRFPSLSQLYLRDTDNPNLRQEVVYHYQLGMEQKLPGESQFSFEGFRSDLHNVIVIDQNVVPARNENFSLYRFTGFETSLESRLLPKLALRGSYTFNRSQDLSGVGRDEVQYVPRDKAVFTGKYDFDSGLTPFVSLVYVANSYVYSKQQIATVTKAKLADYAVVSVKLTQKLYKDKLQIYVGADNLFNVEYEQSYGVPRPGRLIYGGFEYRFGS